MSLGPSDLRTVPLFDRITDDHLRQLMDAFERHQAPPGEVLFEAGATPDHFLLLVAGEVALLADDEVRFRLRPIAPIGELGAVTGVVRNVRAVVTAPSEIWRIEVAALVQFFERHGDVAFPFYNNLLDIVATKLRRDGRRMEEMRNNLIRTQKAMKKLREMVLSEEENPLSRTLADTLDDLIEHNRRAHYLIEPTHTLASIVRLDDGSAIPVLEMSDAWLHLAPRPGVPGPGARLTGVLVLSGGEIAVSGAVKTSDDSGAHVKLDLLIEEYAEVLRDHLTRVQMLDFVV